MNLMSKIEQGEVTVVNKLSKCFGVFSVLLLVVGAPLFLSAVEMGGRAARMRQDLTQEEYAAYEKKAKLYWNGSLALLGLSAVSYALRVGFGLAGRRS